MAKKIKAKSKTKPKAKAKAKARVKTKRPVRREPVDMDDSVEQAVEVVDLLCVPDLMTKAEAVEYLGRVIDHCQASVEALEEEIENEKAAA